MRKRLIGAGESVTAPDDEIDIGACASVSYSSEDPAHPVEGMLDGHRGPGGTYWSAASADTTEQIVIVFDAPQSISRLTYEVEENRRERTQQVRIEISSDKGETYRQVLAQDYTFSPNGATFQHEDIGLNAADVTHVRLTIVPNKGGPGTATLVSLRLFAGAASSIR